MKKNRFKNIIPHLLWCGILFLSIQNSVAQDNKTKDAVDANATQIKTDSTVVNTNQEIIKDSVLFSKTLSFQKISFEIKGFKNQLIITTNGYTVDNKTVSKPIDGTITNAEIEDLNSDGYPEVIIFITASGTDNYGSIIGFSSNANKSMSEIAFPSFVDNPKINKGYNGHDEFAIVETNVVQRFPIYNEGKPTGKIRQIQYKLIDGEALRSLEITKIIEF